MAKVLDQCCICAGTCPHVNRSHVFCTEHKDHARVLNDGYAPRFIAPMPIPPVMTTKISCPCGMTLDSNSEAAIEQFLKSHDGYHAARTKIR